MFLRPQLPPTPTHTTGSSPVLHAPAPPCACQHPHTSAVEPARRSLRSVSAGAIGAVLAGGVVLTALLAAVAVAAVSVAVAAVVLRSLLHQNRPH